MKVLLPYFVYMAKLPIIRKMTRKGQVTLPSSWRQSISTDNVLINDKGNGVLEITPHEIEGEWGTIFDAARDNKGKGIPADSLIKLLERIDKE